MSFIKYFNIFNYLRFIKRTINKIRNLERDIESLKLNFSRNELSKLKNKFDGERCFILGNGPSLSIEDIEKLKNEKTFASNKIFLLFKETEWRPTFYSVEDHWVFKQNIDEIEAVEAKYKIFPNYKLATAPIFSNSIYFKHDMKDRSPLAPLFSSDMLKGLHGFAGIVYTQIQMACYMGFSEIYLLGVDFNYIEPKSKKGNALVSNGEINHFHKDYRRPGEVWSIPKLDYHEKAYLVAKSETDKKGIKVYNSTRGGKLEVFPRVNLDDLLN